MRASSETPSVEEGEIPSGPSETAPAPVLPPVAVPFLFMSGPYEPLAKVVSLPASVQREMLRTGPPGFGAHVLGLVQSLFAQGYTVAQLVSMGVSRDVLDDAISLSQGASVGDNIFHMPIPPHSLPIPAPFISAPVHSFPFQHVPLQQIPMHQLPIPIQPQHQIHPFHFVHQQHNPFQQQQQHQNQNQQQSPKKHARKRRQTKQQQQQDEDQAERRRLLAAYNSYTNPNPPIVAPMYPAIGSFSSSTTYPIFPRRPSYSNSTPPPPAIPPPNVPKPPVETSVEPETIDEVKNVETDATKKDDAVKKEDETKQDGLSLLEKLRASLRASKLTVKESQPTTLRQEDTYSVPLGRNSKQRRNNRRAQMHRERQLDVENRRDEVMEDGEITIKTGGQSGSEKNRSGSGSDMDISDDEKALKVGAEVEKKNESDSSMDTDSSSEDESGSASDSSDSSDDSEEDPAAKAKNWRERIFATQKTQLNGSSASLDASAVVLETPSIELSPQPTPAVSVAPSTVSETSPPPVSAPSAVVVLAPATTAVPKPSARPRPSASDLNLRPPPMQQHRPTGPSKKFIPHKSYHNFVIEVSDSSSDDEPAPPPGPTRQQLLEEKIREMKERIAEKEREKREKMGKESVSETGTPVVVHSSIPSFNLPAVESKPVFPQVHIVGPTTVSEQLTPSSASSTSPPKASTSATSSTSTTPHLHPQILPKTSQSSQPLLSPPKLSPKPISPQRQLQQPSLSLRKTTLETQIAADEALLASAIADISTKETLLTTLQKDASTLDSHISQTTTTISTLETELARIQSELSTQKQTLNESKKKVEDIRAEEGRIRRLVLGKGRSVEMLRGMVNERRKELLQVLKALQQEVRKTSGEKRGVETRGGGGDESGGKKSKLGENEKEKEEQVDGDGFIRFTDGGMDEMFGNGVSTGGAQEKDGVGARSVEEVERERKYREIEWNGDEEQCTIDRLVSFGGEMVLMKMDEVCGVSDLVACGLGVERVGGLGGDVDKVRAVPSISFEAPASIAAKYVPFESPLIQFRSHRYFQASTDVTAKQLGAGNKIDPHKVMCKNETGGGVCKDIKCTAQHFRDVSLTENEVVLDLLAHLEADDSVDMAELRALVQRGRVQGKSADQLVQVVLEYRKSRGPRSGVVFKESSKVLVKDEAILDPRIFKNSTLRSGYVSKDEDVYPPSMIPPSQAVFLQGLQRVLDGEKPKVERYYDLPLDAEQYKEMIARDPNNADIWINYAASVLPNPLSVKELLKTDKDVVKCINILAEALEHHRESENVWIAYLEMNMKRAGEEDTREMFEQGVAFLPKSVVIWWRYFVWETGFERKENVLRRMLVWFSGDESSSMDSTLRSSTVLSVAIQLMKLYLENLDESQTARSFMAIFLLCRDATELAQFKLNSNLSKRASGTFLPPLRNTWATAVLTDSDLAKAWLIYLHFLYHGTLPQSVFLPYPHDYLVRDEYFCIRWDVGRTNSGATIPSGIEHSFFRQLFHSCVNAWKSAMPTDESKQDAFMTPWLAILKNFVEFWSVSGSVGDERIFRKVWDGVLEAVPEKFLGIVKCLVNESSDDEVLVPGSFYLVNRCVKELLATNGKNGEAVSGISETIIRVVDLLINSVRCCFEGLEQVPVSTVGVEGIVRESLDLYETLLGISANYQAPDLVDGVKSSSGKLKSNVFLWLNYFLLQNVKVQSNQHQLESASSLRTLFEQSLESVKFREGRYLIWREYLSFEMRCSMDGTIQKRALGLLWRAVDDLAVVEENPLTIGKGGEHSVEFTKLVGVAEYRDAADLLKSVVVSLPRERATEVLDMMLKTVPDLVYELPQFSKLYFESSLIDFAKAFLLSYVKRNPKSVKLWKLMYSIENLGGLFGTREACIRICNKAIGNLPPSEARYFTTALSSINSASLT